MADEFKHVIFVKVDVDEIEELCEDQSIQVMPTFILYRNGEKVVVCFGCLSSFILAQMQDIVEGNNPDTLRSKIELHGKKAPYEY